MTPYRDKKNTVALVFSCNDMFTKPVVTIGMCVKNCEASVKEAIDSVLDQDFPHELMEVILVDDGSEDGTLSCVLDSVSRMDMHVRVFHSEWRGLGPARNVVVDNARGDYIVWVDGDMTLPKDHVRRQVEFMEQNPNVGIAKAKYARLHGENLLATLENIKFVVEDTRAKNEWKITSKLPGTGGSIYRVKAIRQVGGFDDHLKGVGEDQDAAYRVKAAGWLLYRTPTVFYEKHKKTWKALWDKYFWYGCSDHCLYCKNRSIFSLHKMVPLAGFVTGLLYSFIAYRLTRLKVSFLLPLHFAFQMTAWCSGFARSQINSYRYTSKEHRVADLIERKLLLSDPYYQLILRMMKSVTESFHGKRILEVGCGLGGFCIRIAKRGADPVGLDISSSAIDKAKYLAKCCGVQSQVDFIIGDAQFLPFKNQSNEFVICSETLEHVENYEQAFRELVRVIEKSGYLCLTVPNLFSTLFFEYIVLLSVGQPKYAKKLGNVEKEHVFHLLKVKRLFSREDLKLIDIRSTDFLHLPPTIRKSLGIDHYLNVLSEKLEKNGGALRLFGASIGILARKE